MVPAPLQSRPARWSDSPQCRRSSHRGRFAMKEKIENMRGLLLPAALLVLLIPCRATHPSRQGAQPAGWRETHLFSEDRLWRRQLPTPGLSVGQSAAWIRSASALPVRNVNRTGCAGITHSLEGHEVILKTAVLFKQCTATPHSARADEERPFPIQRPGLSWRIPKTQ
jgi:hypothetical protein